MDRCKKCGAEGPIYECGYCLKRLCGPCFMEHIAEAQNGASETVLQALQGQAPSLDVLNTDETHLCGHMVRKVSELIVAVNLLQMRVAGLAKARGEGGVPESPNVELQRRVAALEQERGQLRWQLHCAESSRNKAMENLGRVIQDYEAQLKERQQEGKA